jgi:hypothetical protein
LPPLEFTYLLVEFLEMTRQPIDQLPELQRQLVAGILQQGRHPLGDVADTLRDDQPQLAQ